MVGTLIRWLLGFFGVKLQRNPNHTSPSNTINAFFGWTTRPWLGGSLLSGLTGFLVLGVLCHVKWDHIAGERWTIAYLWIAVLWGWVGPVLIWRYETITLEKARKAAAGIIPDADSISGLSAIVDANATGGWKKRCIVLMWIAWMIYAYVVLSFEFVAELGINGYGDVWWWLLLAGVIVYNYYGAIGWLLVWKSITVVRFVARQNTALNPYHEDGTGGFGFIGDLVTTTSLMFSTGVLFLPILLKIAFEKIEYFDIRILGTTIAYAGAILLSFAYPVWVIHRKLVKEKARLARPLRGTLSSWLLAELGSEDLIREIGYMKLSLALRDIVRTNDWPFNLANVLKITVSAVSPVVYLLIRLRLG